MYGIFVNEDGGVHYAKAIVEGHKKIETRSKAMLRQLVGERVAVIRTRKNTCPVVLGYVDISRQEYWTREELDSNRDKTLIPCGSKHDCHGDGKFVYYLYFPKKCDPYPLPADAVRHGRSWCEF